jgi:hypothetical protein
MALPILQIERKFREINPETYKTDFVFYGVINTRSANSKLRIPNSELGSAVCRGNENERFWKPREPEQLKIITLNRCFGFLGIFTEFR